MSRHPGRRSSGDGPGSNYPHYRASGPGPKTRDGCSVELYRRLPYFGEVDLLGQWVPSGSSVLELGCGVGRVTRPLVAAGYRVTAVDNSAEMLAYAPAEAAKIRSNIEDLDLGKSFDAVILGSCLVNIPDEVILTEQLARCRRHLRTEGVLLLERHDPEWLARVEVGPVGSSIGTIDMSVLEPRHRGDEVDLCFRYADEGEAWLQYFTARILDDAAIALLLAGAGFASPTWINRRWCAAAAR